MIKKFSILILSLAMVLSFGFSTSAAPKNQKENTAAQEKANKEVEVKKAEIQEVMRQLSEYRTRKLLNERKQDGSLGTQNDISSNLVDDRYEMELEAKLNALGVKKLTQSEAEAIYSQSNSDEVSAMVTVPNSNANVKWYEIRYSHYKNNQSYDLQDLYAQGIGYNTNLSVARDGATLYTNKQIAINNLKEVGSIYVEKFVGAAFSLVPLVGWAPWELFFQDNTNVTNNSHVISYGSLSTICFTYVKLAGKDDSWQKLSFVSNTFSIAAGHTLRGIKNGLPFTHSKDTNNTVYAENYSSGYKAVDSYLNTSTQRSSFARYFRFYNHDKTANITAYVLNPSVPTQITIN